LLAPKTLLFFVCHSNVDEGYETLLNTPSSSTTTINAEDDTMEVDEVSSNGEDEKLGTGVSVSWHNIQLSCSSFFL